jgi:arylsulfatase A-like enzyme
METDCDRLYNCAFLGALHGAAAWSAYAVVEFVFSSVLFRIFRPYAIFTAWHWQLTAELLIAYVVTGAVAGGLAGGAVWLLGRNPRLLGNKDRPAVLEAAAGFTLVAAFSANIIAIPTSPSGKYFLLGVSGAFALALVAAMRSNRWSERFALLTNPWIMSGLLLGVGQLFGLFELEDVAEQMGAKFALWLAALIVLLIVTTGGAILLGGRVRRIARRRATLFPPGWAALACAALLIPASAVLANAEPAQTGGLPVAAGSARPNLLVIVMDTVRADHMSIYGYKRDTTPNLKKLAADSVLYTNALAPSNFTLTSHASLFTGMYPSWHGAYCDPPDASYGRAVSAGVPTLAEILSRNGYRTLGVSANMYLRAELGLQRGFNNFDIPRPIPVLDPGAWYMLRRAVRREIGLVADTSQFDRLYSRGQDIDTEFLSMLDLNAGGPAPFFAFVNYMDAHFPYIPPPPFDREFPGKIRGTTQDDLEAVQQRVIGGGQMPPADYRHATSQYDGGIAYTDAAIGRLAGWLKQHKLYDNTMIVITSDHGEAFGEKHYVLHANSEYQNLLHVALMIKYPKQAAKGVVSTPVSLIDVMPTALTSLGVPVPGAVQGIDLLDMNALRGRKELFSEGFACPVVHPPGCPENGCTQRAIVAWPYKYIDTNTGKRALYDIAADPDENRNLMALDATDSDRLSAALGAWVKTFPLRARQQPHVNGESLQRLKSLGYVQ